MDNFVKLLLTATVNQTERVAKFFATRGLLIDASMAKRVIEVVWLIPLVPSTILLEVMVAMLSSQTNSIVNIKTATSTQAHRNQLSSMGLTLNGLKACLSDEQASFIHELLKYPLCSQSQYFKAVREHHITRNEMLRSMSKELEVVKGIPEASKEALIENWRLEVEKGVLANNTLGSLMRTYMHKNGHTRPVAEVMGVVYYGMTHKDSLLPSEEETISRVKAAYESGF